MEEKESIEELIYQETDRRLQEMQSDTYEFPKKMTKTDYILITAAVLVCVGLIVACMLGVIR